MYRAGIGGSSIPSNSQTGFPEQPSVSSTSRAGQVGSIHESGTGSAAQTPAFRSLLAVAVRARADLQSRAWAPGQFEEHVYSLYATFPLTPEQAREIRSQYTMGEGQDFIQHAQALNADGIHVVLDPWRPGAPILRPADALRLAGSEQGPSLQQVFEGHYRMFSSNFDPRRSRTEEGLECRLSVKANPMFDKCMDLALKDICQDGLNGLSHVKLMSPGVRAARSESAAIYVNTSNPEEISELGAVLDDAFRQRVEAAIQAEREKPVPNASWLHQATEAQAARKLYGTPPPGTELLGPGIAYSEKPRHSPEHISSGQEKVFGMIQAVRDSMNGVPLEDALMNRMREKGYSPNPAFAARPGDTAESLQRRIDELRSMMPELEDSPPETRTPSPPRNDRGRLQVLLDRADPEQ